MFNLEYIQRLAEINRNVNTELRILELQKEIEISAAGGLFEDVYHVSNNVNMLTIVNHFTNIGFGTHEQENFVRISWE